jgi:predicted dienelactone hydrolase
MKTHLPTFTRWVCALTLLMASASHAQVGMRQIQSGDMPITLIYPTEAVAQAVVRGPFKLQAALNAAPAPVAPGSRKLVVLSHGTAGSQEPDFQLAATLAKAGFVVAQPLHRGDNFRDFSKAGPESWKTRPQDVSETIDAVAHDAVLGPQVNTQSVGVHGMSAGGVTGLALAGAQWRLLNLVQHCAQNLDADIGFCLNGLRGQTWPQLVRKAQFTMARFLTEDHAPAALKTLHGGQNSGASPNPRPDPRVAAVSLNVPVGAIFTAESLARITIPVGLTTAGNDGVLATRFHSGHVLKHCQTCTTLSDHPVAGHFDWLGPWPSSVAQTVAASQMRGGLPNPAFSDEARQKAFDQIALFFKRKL